MVDGQAVGSCEEDTLKLLAHEASGAAGMGWLDGIDGLVAFCLGSKRMEQRNSCELEYQGERAIELEDCQFVKVKERLQTIPNPLDLRNDVEAL